MAYRGPYPALWVPVWLSGPWGGTSMVTPSAFAFYPPTCAQASGGYGCLAVSFPFCAPWLVWMCSELSPKSSSQSLLFPCKFCVRVSIPELSPLHLHQVPSAVDVCRCQLCDLDSQ